MAEARALREIAKQQGVVTQMGNQGTATEAFRRAVELIQAGSLGKIQEIHVWDGGGSGPRKPPEGSEPVPEGLNWDLWLGPAAERPFHSRWYQWHGWRDFATGNAGNWGPHSGNLPFKTFQIDSLWYADPAANPRIRVHAVHPVAQYRRPSPLAEIRSPTDRNSATASLTRRQTSGRLADRMSLPVRLLARDGPECPPRVKNSTAGALRPTNRCLARQVQLRNWPARAMRVERGASPDQPAAKSDEFSRANRRVGAAHAPRTAAG